MDVLSVFGNVVLLTATIARRSGRRLWFALPGYVLLIAADAFKPHAPQTSRRLKKAAYVFTLAALSFAHGYDALAIAGYVLTWLDVVPGASVPLGTYHAIALTETAGDPAVAAARIALATSHALNVLHH